MEVHHHTHTARRKWTHYFWEFLMLFLAVFAGFLAENIREHYVEHQRARVLAGSLYHEIRSDTAALNRILVHTRTKMNHLDSLASELHKLPSDWNDTTMSRQIFWLVRFQAFERSQSTFEQLKSSGSLRYFSHELVGLLNAYDVTAQNIKLREEGEYGVLWQRVVPMSMRTVNFEMIYAYSFDHPYDHEIYFKLRDKEQAEYLINEAVGIKIVRNRLKTLYEQLFFQAEQIIKYLVEKYKL